MKDHRDAVKDLQARQAKVQRITEGLPAAIATAVAGHAGESTVSVTAGGAQARVEISGPDAGEQVAQVRAKAMKAVSDHLKDPS